MKAFWTLILWLAVGLPVMLGQMSLLGKVIEAASGEPILLEYV